MVVSAVLDACVLYPVGLRDTSRESSAGTPRFWQDLMYGRG